jgi:AraC-like DNA-binding protein
MNYNDNIFKIQESNKILYKIEGIRPTGHFYSTRRDLDLDIHQVLKVKNRALDKEITIAKAKEIATDIGISYEVLQRVAYNLTKGVFNKYIDEWRARLANTL